MIFGIRQSNMELHITQKKAIQPYKRHCGKMNFVKNNFLFLTVMINEKCAKSKWYNLHLYSPAGV